MKQLLIKIPVSQSIEEVMDYIQYSEMEGEVDPTDSWYSTYQSLKELQEKVLDEEEMLDRLTR
jgi:thiaminase